MSRAPVSRIRSAPVPADSGTTFTVLADEGDCFPNVPFTALIWPTQTLPQLGPAWDLPDRNAEEVYVTEVLGDNFTCVRSEWPITIRGDMMVSALYTQPVYNIGDMITLTPLAYTGTEPFTLHLAHPNGTQTTADAGGTATYELQATASGEYTWCFEDVDGKRSDEGDFFVRFTEVG